MIAHQNSLQLVRLLSVFQLVFIALFLPWLTACTGRANWNTWQHQSRISCYNFAETAYRSPNPLTGLELRFRRSSAGTYGYITVSRGNIPCPADYPGKAEITLYVEGEPAQTYLAECLEGNQRLLLPEECTRRLLDLLQEERSLTLELDHHCAEIPASGFTQKFHRLEKTKLIDLFDSSLAR